MAGDRWLTRAEAAAEARCSVRTISRAIQSGHLRSTKPEGTVLIREDWFDAWLLSRRPSPDSVCIAVMDDELRFVAVNERYAKLIGLPAAEIVGRSAWEFSAKKGRKKEEALEELRALKVIDGMSTVVTVDGRRIPCRFRTEPVNGGQLHLTTLHIDLEARPFVSYRDLLAGGGPTGRVSSPSR